MQKLTYNEKFIKKWIEQYGKMSDFTNMNLFKDLSESFIREYKDYLEWYNLSVVYPFNDNFIREFKKYINWTVVIMYRKDIDWKYKNAWAKELNLKNRIEDSFMVWWYDEV